LQLRLRKAMLGNLGDHKSVGGQVWEMRESFGPGWRLYYTLRGTTLIVMLAGGDKSPQARDIERAKAMVLELLDGHDQDPPV
jgi:putative addiction module killer protein